MSWRDRLLPASFAGIAFSVLDDEVEFGRRLTQTEYPFRETADLDDFGAAAEEYVLGAVFVGPDFDQQRDRFIRLAKAKGAGDLVHPQYGRFRARLRSARISHRVDEGGMCRATLTFKPEAAADYPVATVDEVAKALAAAEGATAATRAGFLAKYRVLGWPSQVLEAARERVTRYGSLVQATTAPPLADAQAVAEFARRTRALVNVTDSVLADPLQVAERIVNLSAGVRRLFGRDALAEFNRLRRAFFDPHPVGQYSTPALRQTVANADALNALIRQLSLEDSASAAISATYTTRQDAEVARDQVADGLAEEAALAAGELPALLDLRAAVLVNVPQPGLKLPSVVTYQVPRTVPSLVLAYQLYGDASRAADIVTRNDIAAPAFIVGGAVLEVLTDGA
jgi:prophage DNA circulation protein